MQVDRQRADLQRRRQFLRRLQSVFAVEPTGDLGALAAVDPVRVFLEVDDRPALDFVVEDDREVAGERRRFFGADGADRRRRAALGDLPGDRLEVFTPVVGEFERDVRFARALRVFLLRFGDFRAGERRVVFQREPARLRGFVELAAFVRRQFGDEDRAGRDFDDDPVFRQRFAGRAFVEVFLATARGRRAVCAVPLFRRGSTASCRSSIFRSFRPVPVRRRAARRCRRSGRRPRRSASCSRSFPGYAPPLSILFRAF